MRQTKKILLFCFPYAGGSAIVYNNWKATIDRSIRLKPIELPGRGMRFKEPFYKSMHEANDDVYNQIKPEIDHLPYMFWGHSMGSLIAYELHYKITANGHAPPAHIFFSGMKPPQIPSELKNTNAFTDDKFKQVMVKLGGTPPMFVRDKRLAKLFLPIMKADMAMAQTYAYEDQREPLACNIDVFYGKNDDLTPAEDIRAWQQHTSKKCGFHEFQGGHFFLHEHITAISEIINNATALGFAQQ
jgi:surfactin synthase thioesterase subunit